MILDLTKFLGKCYKDDRNRVLKGDSACIEDGRCFLRSRTDMTIEMCKKFCHKNGWAIAGVEHFRECYCGNKLPTKILPDSKCNRPCSGNSDQNCGGGYAMNIFYSPGE